jgi:hypothetical protein
MLRHDATTIST